MASTTTAPQFISPTDVEFYVDHSVESLSTIVAKYTADSAYIAQFSGVDHPLSIEAMKIANAAWGALVTR
jgi:hypothetical protein